MGSKSNIKVAFDSNLFFKKYGPMDHLTLFLFESPIETKAATFTFNP